MRFSRSKTIYTLAVAAAALGLFSSDALAQGNGILRMGLTYNIAFPDVQPGQLPINRVEPGMHTYRILAYGGDQWYRVQRVYKHPNGGWQSVPNTDDMWVNMGYAFAITEALR